MRLSEVQINKLSDIAADIGLVTLAAVALPYLLDKFRFIKRQIICLLSI